MICSISDKTHLLALGKGDITPTDDDLAAAPFLDNWHIGNFSLLGYRVIGIVTGHPTIDDGDINTSTPLHADLDRGWLRTRSRFYRLGIHKGDRS
jgi:hypothetical protein